MRSNPIHFEVALLLVVLVDDIVVLVLIFVVVHIRVSYCQLTIGTS